MKTIHLRNDDSIGQLADALYGAYAIPERWLHLIAWRDRITDLADRLSFPE